MKKKILIVDDSHEDRELLKAILENKGYVMVEAVNGRQAMDVIRAEAPDLIFMDIRMPKVDGITASKILRSEKSTQCVPIIIITSFAMHGEIEKIAADTGCTDYISKPIDIKKTVEMVEKYIGPAEKVQVGS